MIRLLVIDNHDSFVFNIVQLLREHPRVTYDLIREDELYGDEMTRYDALLLSPGPGIPEEYPRMMRLIAEGVGHYPILGICLGHQAIAQHLGAKLHQLPHPLHGHPAPLVDIDHSDPVVGSITEGSIVGRYHSWVVSRTDLPACLIPTAYSEGAESGATDLGTTVSSREYDYLLGQSLYRGLRIRSRERATSPITITHYHHESNIE